MFFSCPYPISVLNEVAGELWFRQLGIGAPRILSDGAGVLLDHLTERGFYQLVDFRWLETNGNLGDRWFHWLIEDLVEEIWEYPIDKPPTGGTIWQVREGMQRILAGDSVSQLSDSLDNLARLIPAVHDPNYRQLLFILLYTGQVLQYPRQGLGPQMMTFGYQYHRWLLYPILDKLIP